MDELFALLSVVKDGEVTEAQEIKRLSRSPHWVWVAMDPVNKLILTVDVGERTLSMAQRLVHQVTQVLAPHSTPFGQKSQTRFFTRSYELAIACAREQGLDLPSVR